MELQNKANQLRKHSGTLSVTDLVYGKVPPQAKDLEEAILGAAMLERDGLTTAIQFLQPEYFYVDAHQRIFKAIMELYRKSQPVDILTVVEQLRKTDEIETVGGAYYVTKLTNAVTSSAHLEAHSKIVAQKYIQREIIRLGGQMIAEGYDDTADCFETLDEVSQGLSNLALNEKAKVYTTIGTSIDQVFSRIDQIRSKPAKSISGTPSGIPELDQITDGWQDGDLIILAARPSVGKSAVAGNLARLAAQSKEKPTGVGIFSLEMSHNQWTERILSAQSSIELTKIKKGDLTNEQVNHLKQIGYNEVAGLKLLIDDSANLNIYSLKAKARMMVQKEGVGLIILDYLQLMGGDRSKGQNREQEISAISRGLKQLAKELNVPIIALSQLNRESEKGGMPTLSSLRESGAIEQDADMVIFLVPPSETLINNGEVQPNEILVKIAKHRNGSLETIAVTFVKDIQRIQPVPKLQNNTFEHYSPIGGNNWQGDSPF
jgi:replicative DNA helicase